MARSATKDPLDKFRWQVDIVSASSGNYDFLRSGFMEVETPGITYTTKEYPEGGRHLHPRQIIDSATYKPVSLTRGVTANTDFLSWAQGPIKATGAYSAKETFTNIDYRKHVVIYHLDRTGQAVKIYVLFNAIPVEFHPASDFSANGDDSISMEKLVLKYESFKVISTANNPTIAGSIGDIVKQAIRNF